MSYRLEFEIPGLPKMANGTHGHWRTRYHAERKWQSMTLIAIAGKRPLAPLEKVRCEFVRFSSSEPDFDGLVHGFKPIRDALVRGGIVINDKPSNMEAKYRWEKAAQKQGKIRVTVEAV